MKISEVHSSVDWGAWSNSNHPEILGWIPGGGNFVTTELSCSANGVPTNIKGIYSRVSRLKRARGFDTKFSCVRLIISTRKVILDGILIS